ncbi:MAG: hypothetical protein IH898_09015 [Planctomycetes bacterium]|nr:hypothetical protein [Planctomycetota bacterium]
MPGFLNQQIAPPDTWQEFEKLCRDLWERIWGDPNTQLNGRGGQSQHGVDVFGHLGGSGDLQGVQCKGKDGRYGRFVTEKELRAEVKKAKKFQPAIKAFILATTAPSDAPIQEVARLLTVEHKVKGLFSVQVLGWGEIHQRFAGYPELIDKYYPDQGPTHYKISETLAQIMERQMAIEAAQFQLPTALTQALRQERGAIGIIPMLDDGAADPNDEALNLEIDSYRDRIKSVPRTALSLLQQLRERCWEVASERTRFRIVTNIGAAHNELNENSQAADHYLEAANFAANDDDKAVRNVAYAYLIKDELARAREEAHRAIKLNPDEGDGYAILVAASATLEGIEDPETLVPDVHLSKANVVYTIGHAHRIRGDLEKGLKWFKRAYELEPETHQYRASYGSELIAKIIDKGGAALDGYLNDADLDELKHAADLLHEVWEETKGTEVAASFAWVGINLCNALSVMKRDDEAKALVPEVIGLKPDSPELRKLAAVFALKDNNPNAALDHLSHIPEGLDTEIDLLRAETLAEASRFKEALELVDSINFPPPMQIHQSAAQGFRIRVLAKVDENDVALDAARKAEENYPDDPILLVSISMALSEMGFDDDAKEKVKKAADLLHNGSTPFERIAVADALYDYELFAIARGVYKSLVKSHKDSQILRRLLICQYQTDQRKSALDTLGMLPESTRSLKFYRRYAAAIYMRSGELEKARDEAEAYLSQEPDDLEIRINWIGLNQRLGKEDVIRDFLSTVPEYPEANPIDQVSLSHLLTHYGFPDRGLQLAYRLLREQQDVPEVHLGYISLMLQGRLPAENFSVSTVAEDTAFVLEDARGNLQSFIIEGQWTDKRFADEILPTHPIAQQANGKSVGDTVVVPSNPFQTDERKIVELKSKYVYIAHTTMERFSTLFPDKEGFWKIDVGAKEGDGYNFAPIFKVLDDRQSRVLRVAELYRSGPYPIGFIAGLLGAHPLEVWPGLMQSGLLRIRCCEGTAPERETAFDLVEKSSSGFVVDPLTLYSVVSLGVHKELTNAFGRLGITQSTLDMYKSFVEERRHYPTSGTMAKIGDQYTYQEFTKEQIEEDLKKYGDILAWAENNCDVLAAVGDMPQQWLGLNDHIHHAFTDTVVAASGAGRLLLSDDQHLRAMAKQMMGVEGVWLQILMLKAVERDVLAIDQYCDATANLIEAGIDFMTIDQDVLFRTAKSEGWEHTDRLKKMLSTIGGEKVDLKSSLGVASKFLHRLWHYSLLIEKKEVLTRAVIDALTKNHSKLTSALIQVLIQIGTKFGPDERDRYLETIKKWCADNCIAVPPALSTIRFMRKLRKLKSFLLGTTSHTR